MLLLRRIAPALIGLSAVVLVSAPPQPVHAATVPAYDHVFVIVMENHSFGEIIGSPSAPYINSLLGGGGLATNYFAVAHPSLPNYLALTGGSTFGISFDCTTCWVGAANIGDNVEAAGKSWKAYMESMPSPCYVGDSYPYAQKHNPFVYYNDIRLSGARCQAHDVPYSQLASDLQSTSTTPNYAFITPNMCSDMHDCSVGTGDSWLSQQVPQILGSPAFRSQRSLLALTWDEDDFSGTNQVATILVGSGVGAGVQSGASYNHYSLLHTVESALGVATLTPNDAGAPTMSSLFNPFFTAPRPYVGRYDGTTRAGIAWVDGETTGVSLSTGAAFSAAAPWATQPFYGSKATLSGDVTGSGMAALVSVNRADTWVMTSTGTSFSAPAQWSGTPFYGSRGTFLADVNGDGRADLVAVNDSSVWVMLSTGAGFAAPTQWSSARFFGGVSTLVADVSGDGKADLVAVNPDSTWVMTSTGSGFAAPTEWSSNAFFGAQSTIAADVTGTGRAGLVAINYGDIWVMTSTGGGFSAPVRWSSTPFYGGRATLAGDVNGDGKADLVAVNDASVWVETSSGSGFSAPTLWLAGPP